LNAYTFHISPYDLGFLAMIFIGLTFALLLGFTNRTNRTANRFPGLTPPLAFDLWIKRVLILTKKNASFDLPAVYRYIMISRIPVAAE
jgi:hypothetical protein